MVCAVATGLIVAWAGSDSVHALILNTDKDWISLTRDEHILLFVHSDSIFGKDRNGAVVW